ncbi:MAG: hypothetical protein H6741_35100 [Alphaproteobacteria bacterium]|nr:hypothetical protein [Alphaproteobacteria bacterium]
MSRPESPSTGGGEQGVWSLFDRPIPPRLLTQADFDVLTEPLRAQGAGELAEQLAAASAHLLATAAQAQPDTLLGRFDFLPGDTITALEAASEVLVARSDSLHLGCYATALATHLWAWDKLHGLKVVMRSSVDAEGRPAIDVMPGAWPPDPADFAEGEDAPIPGFDSPVADR